MLQKRYDPSKSQFLFSGNVDMCNMNPFGPGGKTWFQYDFYRSRRDEFFATSRMHTTTKEGETFKSSNISIEPFSKHDVNKISQQLNIEFLQ